MRTTALRRQRGGHDRISHNSSLSLNFEASFQFLLNSYGDDGEPTDSNGVAARKELLSAIKDINSTLVDMDLGKHIPVGTADAVRRACTSRDKLYFVSLTIFLCLSVTLQGSAITEELCAGVDYFMGMEREVKCGPFEEAHI